MDRKDKYKTAFTVPLNKCLQWIRYPIPNKRDLIKRLSGVTIYSKFDMKSGYWQIQVSEKDVKNLVPKQIFGRSIYPSDEEIIL